MTVPQWDMKWLVELELNRSAKLLDEVEVHIENSERLAERLAQAANAKAEEVAKLTLDIQKSKADFSRIESLANQLDAQRRASFNKLETVGVFKGKDNPPKKGTLSSAVIEINVRDEELAKLQDLGSAAWRAADEELDQVVARYSGLLTRWKELRAKHTHLSQFSSDAQWAVARLQKGKHEAAERLTFWKAAIEITQEGLGLDGSEESPTEKAVKWGTIAAIGVAGVSLVGVASRIARLFK